MAGARIGLKDPPSRILPVRLQHGQGNPWTLGDAPTEEGGGWRHSSAKTPGLRLRCSMEDARKEKANTHSVLERGAEGAGTFFDKRQTPNKSQRADSSRIPIGLAQGNRDFIDGVAHESC